MPAAKKVIEFISMPFLFSQTLELASKANYPLQQVDWSFSFDAGQFS
jgi:hypothetical protein